ncbi:hypothetical protein KTD31_02120 [Burkholderia multivorans]|jgi:hypothetical protein|uniref:hypothetical protein n=1 Tax=Burkholderia multivorans TaxID=87883 RepID=UPI001C24D1D9|nr:hypothetical protein [Burkholderia multivorans]MBU9200201.1 hypothetical protein [Burkholderia multivorans]MDN8078674.1 hypothetical protein [Burkholderia multivorans]
MKNLKDHEIRELVNQLRDTAILFHNTQQLRERISHIVHATLGTREPAPADFEAFMKDQYGPQYPRAAFPADAMRACWAAAQAAMLLQNRTGPIGTDGPAGGHNLTTTQ